MSEIIITNSGAGKKKINEGHIKKLNELEIQSLKEKLKEAEKKLGEAGELIQNAIIDIHSCWCGVSQDKCNFHKAKDWLTQNNQTKGEE